MRTATKMLTKSFQKGCVGRGLALGLFDPVNLAGFRKGVAHCCNQAAADQISDFFRLRFDLRQLGQRARILRRVVLGDFQQTDFGSWS